MFRPLGDRVLVKRTPELSITKGGIIIPETYKEKPMEGTVESIGEEVKRVKVGERVLYAKYSGVDIKLREGNYLIVVENDILGVIEADKKNDQRRNP